MSYYQQQQGGGAHGAYSSQPYQFQQQQQYQQQQQQQQYYQPQQQQQQYQQPQQQQQASYNFGGYGGGYSGSLSHPQQQQQSYSIPNNSNNVGVSDWNYSHPGGNFSQPAAATEVAPQYDDIPDDIPADAIPPAPLPSSEPIDSSKQVFVKETPEMVASSVQEFRKRTDGSLPAEICLAYIRQAKFDVDRAVTAFEHSDAFRLERGYPRQIPFAEVEKTFREGFYLVGGRDFQGRQILYFRPRLIDPSRKEDLIKTAWCILQGILRDEMTQQRGITMIGDASGASQQNFSKDIVRTMVKTYQGGLPLRIGSFCVCYQPWFFSLIWSFLSWLMKPKLRNRVRVLGSNVHDLQQIAAIDQLPIEVGGTMDITSPQAIDRFCAQRRALDQIPLR